MATFVKKTGNTNYYEISGIRAGGIVPYFIKNNNPYILINQEIRNNKIVYNCIGGRVDKRDKTIYDTMMREFNEETGYLVSDIIKEYMKNKYKFQQVHLKKSKYISLLVPIDFNHIWKFLPYNYENIYEGKKIFNDCDSLSLKWISLFEIENEMNVSYLLQNLIYYIKEIPYFNKYNNQPLFIDD